MKNLLQMLVALCILNIFTGLIGQNCRRLHQVYRGAPFQLLPECIMQENLQEAPFYHKSRRSSRSGSNSRCTPKNCLDQNYLGQGCESSYMSEMCRNAPGNPWISPVGLQTMPQEAEMQLGMPPAFGYGNQPYGSQRSRRCNRPGSSRCVPKNFSRQNYLGQGCRSPYMSGVYGNSLDTWMPPVGLQTMPLGMQPGMPPTLGYGNQPYGQQPFLDPIPQPRYWRYYYHPWRRFPWYRPHGIHLQYFW